MTARDPRFPPKTCRQCGADILPRPKQWPSDFAKKMFCSKRCGARFHQAERIAQMNAGRAVAMADPVRLEDFREKSRRALDMIRPLAVEARRRKALAGCPPEYRETRHYLIYTKRLGVDRAREIIREQMQADARRQIERVNAQMREKAAREKAQAY